MAKRYSVTDVRRNCLVGLREIHKVRGKQSSLIVSLNIETWIVKIRDREGGPDENSKT